MPFPSPALAPALPPVYLHYTSRFSLSDAQQYSMAPTGEQSVLRRTSSDGITTITINRPHVRNAVNAATALQLADAFRSFDRDDTQKVCIFTGAGGTFCAGYDLHEVATNASSNIAHPNPVADAHKGVDGAPGPMGPSRMSLSKPVIAAVSGHAVAGGLELALLADVRVVDTSAVFGVFCRRFGVPLIDGGTVRLPKVVGLGRALDMILTGRPVGAREALAFGLANRVVEKGNALDEAMRIAQSLLRFPQMCMRADLRSAHYGVFDAVSMRDALRFENDGGAQVIERESIQGAARFDQGEGRKGSFERPEKAKL